MAPRLIEITYLCRHQVGQPVAAQQEVEREPLLGDTHPKGPLSPPHRGSDRLP